MTILTRITCSNISVQSKLSLVNLAFAQLFCQVNVLLNTTKKNGWKSSRPHN